MLNSIRCAYHSQFLPKLRLQKLKLGDVYICSLTEPLAQNNKIFSSIACGAHYSWELSILKAQSEYVERKALLSSKIQAATGFAAFPFVFCKKKATRKAQECAYLEMVERYAWPVWFSNQKIHYKTRTEVREKNKNFYEAIQHEIKFLNLYIICPTLADAHLKMVILYALTEAGLVCASAVRLTEEQAEQNALKELYIHAVGLYRMKKDNLQAITNYEKRVAWIGTQHQLLEERLISQGNQAIEIPFPILFEEIKTEFHQTYAVQRCLFRGYDKEFISEDNEMYV